MSLTATAFISAMSSTTWLRWRAISAVADCACTAPAAHSAAATATVWKDTRNQAMRDTSEKS